MEFSLINRRTHMYLGLFLVPWMLIYALSGLALNHGPLLKKLLPADKLKIRYEKESEQTYEGTFVPEADKNMIAEQILADLDMHGSYNVRGPAVRGRYMIFRGNPLKPMRITYYPTEKQLIIEREIVPAPMFLNRLHFKHGYGSRYLANDAWAFVVDVTIAAIIFWVLSGLWMWWELKTTRKWGAALAIAGTALFIFLIIAI